MDILQLISITSGCLELFCCWYLRLIIKTLILFWKIPLVLLTFSAFLQRNCYSYRNYKDEFDAISAKVHDTKGPYKWSTFASKCCQPISWQKCSHDQIFLANLSNYRYNEEQSENSLFILELYFLWQTQLLWSGKRVEKFSC